MTISMIRCEGENVHRSNFGLEFLTCVYQKLNFVLISRLTGKCAAQNLLKLLNSFIMQLWTN